MTPPVQLWIAPDDEHDHYLHALACYMLGDTGVIDGHTYTHPNFFMLHPEEDGKDIALDATRRLLSFCKTTPAYRLPRLVGIPCAHTLSRPSANALLKLTEEPPVNTYIVLCTPNPAKILPTLLSRCTQKRIPSHDVAQAWIQKYPPADAPHTNASHFNMLEVTPDNGAPRQHTQIIGKMMVMALKGSFSTLHTYIDDLPDAPPTPIKSAKGSKNKIIDVPTDYTPLMDVVKNIAPFLYQLIRAPYKNAALSAGQAHLLKAAPHAHWVYAYQACLDYGQDAHIAHIPLRDQIRGMMMIIKDPRAYILQCE